jgi:hypothetical protein
LCFKEAEKIDKSLAKRKSELTKIKNEITHITANSTNIKMIMRILRIIVFQQIR